MKLFLFAALTSLSLTGFASTVVGTNLFPGYGHVPSNQVCLTATSVKAEIAASVKKECTKYSQSFNGATCVAYKNTAVPARSLVAPLSFETQGCIASKTEFTNSLTPHEVCVKYGTVTYHQPRAYSLVDVEQEDVFHDRLVTTRHNIPACQ